jgi:hypothetical protein
MAVLSTGLVVLAVLSGSSGSAPPPGEISAEELVRRTQALFDAVAPGDPTPWRKYLADDCLFTDETGKTQDKATLLGDLQPLPKGYSGSIRIEKVQSRLGLVRDTAILSYDLVESETIHGQELTARYHETDTWMRRNGEWQIVAAQVLRYYEDPHPGRADPERYRAYAGTYTLVPGVAMRITTDGRRLYAQREGRPREELLPETGDLFFRKGIEGDLRQEGDR